MSWVVSSRTKNVANLTIVETVYDAVGTEEETVAGRASDRADLRHDKLVSSTEGSLEDSATRVGFGFALVDLSIPEKPADMGIVMAQLHDRPLGRQMVDPAVTDVAEIHPARSKPAEAERCTHAGTLVVTGPKIKKGTVDIGK